MSKFSEYIGRQFGNPQGFVGRCCCVIMNIINGAMYRKVLENLKADERSNLLDIGYGNGYLIQRLYGSCGANIFGIDISEDMRLQAATRNRDGVNAGKIKLSVGDCCDLPFRDSFFDAVTTINTIYFWEDTAKGLSEIYRVLKQGGVFYNVVYSKEWLQKLSYTKSGFRFFEKDDLLSVGTSAGFSEIVIQDIVYGKSCLVIYKKH